MLKLIFELTTQCNLNCVWCGARKTKSNLPFEDFKTAIDKYKPKHVALTGGEPLLRKDIFKILDYCKNKGIKTELCTNATLITPVVASKINADRINISVDGLEKINDIIRGKNTFAKTVSGIKELKKAGKSKRIVIATVLGPNNKDQAKKIIEYFYPDVRNFMFARVVPVGKAKKEQRINNFDAIKIWFSLLKYKLNPFISTIFTVQFLQMRDIAFSGPFIRADGKIAYCCVKSDKIIGNINTTKKLKSTNCLFCSGCGK